MKRESDNKLIRMANQISEFFDTQTGSKPEEAVASHINGTWTPRMRGRLVDMIKAGESELRETVVTARSLIRCPAEQPAGEEGGLWTDTGAGGQSDTRD